MADIRDPATITEELSDLRRYINGLSTQLIDTGAFVAYQKREELLHEEFIINVPTLTYSHAFYLFLSTECLTEYCLNLFDYFSSIPSSFELALSSLSRNNY